MRLAGSLLALGGAVGVGRMVFLATPRRLASLMADLLDPAPGMEVYEPGCGNGRLLVALDRRAGRGLDPGAPAAPRTARGPDSGAPAAPRLRLYAEELNRFSFGLARANARIHGLAAEIVRTDSLREPAFRRPDGSPRRFDLAIADPMWSQRLPVDAYAADARRRFPFGVPPASNADWGWIQHLHASLSEHGWLVVMLDAEMTSRRLVEGAASEAAIRRAFVEADLVDAVLTGFWGLSRPRPLVRRPLRRLLPEGALLVLDKRKRHPGQVLFIDGEPLVTAYADGRLDAAGALGGLLEAYRRWEESPGLSAVVPTEAIARRGYDLAPRLYVGGARA